MVEPVESKVVWRPKVSGKRKLATQNTHGTILMRVWFVFVELAEWRSGQVELVAPSTR